jgi:CheY-like chemotaxis protein
LLEVSFIVSLAFKASAPVRHRTGATSGLRRKVDPGTRPRSRVLVVDDRDETREMLAWCMRAAGWQVEVAATGEDALLVAYDFRPEVVLLDLNLPGITGLDVARRLQEDELLRGMLVVACSGLERADAEPAALAAGCAAFVAKPCIPEDLRALLESLVSNDED